MRSIFTKFALAALITLVALVAPVVLAESRLDPTQQINWPKIVGSGAPSLSCTSINYGQPYWDGTGNQGYTCDSSGWIANGGSVGAPIQTAPGYTFYVSSGTVYALNNVTGVIDYSGTDSHVVIDAAFVHNAAVCGTMFFHNGIYNFNSLTQETQATAGVSTSPYYAVGIPAYTGTSGQYCGWNIVGETPPVWTGEGQSTPIQTQGVIFNITSTAVSSVSGSALIVGVWQRPASSTNATAGNEILISNIDVRVPTNQRGNEVGFYPAAAGTIDYQNNKCDTGVTNASLVPAVPGTIGMICFTSTLSQQGNVQNFVKNYAHGWDTGYSFLSEHVVGTNDTAIYSNYACKIGDTFNGNTGLANGANLILHPATFINFVDQENIHGCVFGANMVAGSQFNFLGLDIETVTSSSGWLHPTWDRVSNWTETNSGYTAGNISYSHVVAAVGLVDIPAGSFFVSGGSQFFLQDSQATGGFAGGLSGMTSGQAAIAGSASTITSSEALAAGGAVITTGPSSTTSGDCVKFANSAGAIADNGSACGSGGGSGAMTQIAQFVVSGTTTASVDFSGIPGGYTSLELIATGAVSDSGGGIAIYCEINSDTTSGDYGTAYVLGVGTSITAADNSGTSAGADCLNFSGSTTGATAAAQGTVIFAGYAGTAFYKTWNSINSYQADSTFPAPVNLTFTSLWKSTAAITNILVSDTGGGQFLPGSTLTLYGLQ